MESWVLGIFQEQLSKFIVGFRSDQVNANLLNGKGEIKDISLNCTEINGILTEITPYIEFESVHVSKLSFHVSSYTNIKHAPILIDIGDIKATMAEPLDFAGASMEKKIKQITREKLEQLIASGKQKLRGRYSLFDRILDNLSVEVNSVNISFQPRGKFKTKRLGRWTPPKLLATLRHVRYVSVDEHGLEASPDDVWRHNRHHHGQPMWKWTILIFKKLSMEYSFSLLPVDGSPVPPPILKDELIEVQMTYRRRYRDAAILGVQVDTTLSRVEVELASSTVTLLAHAAAGLKYCFSKDRGFEDPLLSHSSQSANADTGIEVALTESASMDPEANESAHDDDTDVVDHTAVVVLDDSVLDRMEELSSSSSSVQDDASISEQEDEEEASKETNEAEQTNTAPAVTANPEQPVLLLPNGIVIHEQVSFSVTVLDCSVRGNYLPKDDGYVQMTIKGLVTEMIWPKITGGKGLYVQNSFSYISVKDCHGPKIRSILIGGVHNDKSNPVEEPSIPVNLDRMGIDSFPLFEDRAIRYNPLGIRPSFPSQALGLKVTVDYVDKDGTEKNEKEEDIMVLSEIGVDQFDLVLDAEPWSRVIRFATNGGDGFNDRWHSGNWTDEVDSDMLVDSSKPLAFKDYVQPCKEFFFDDDFLISSNLFNVTARITNVAAHIPAAVSKDIRSCDIVFSLDESMLLISSALPRTFLNGNIGKTSKEGEILFPNDKSDICYELERTEDPSLRQAGKMTTRNVPTFRVQTTMKGCSVKLVPIIPLFKCAKLEQLIEPTDITLIVCFEEIAELSRKKNRVKLALFVSILLQRVEMNLDFGLLASSLNTVLHHVEVTTDTIDSLQSVGILQKPSVTKEKHQRAIENIGEDGLYIESLIQGLRVMMKRQISRSRKTGGFYISLGLETGDVNLSIWRQSVPLSNRLQSHNVEEKHDASTFLNAIPVVKLLEFHGKGVEISVEGSVFSEARRNVIKICLSEMTVGLCDFESQCESHVNRDALTTTEGEENTPEESKDLMMDLPMVTLVKLDDHSVQEDIRNTSSKTEGYSGVLLRFEEEAGASRSISFGCDVAVGSAVTLLNKEIETFLILSVEALLAPLQAKYRSTEHTNVESCTIFPPGSVGNYLEGLCNFSLWPFSTRAESGAIVNGVSATDAAIIQRIDQVIKKLLPDDVAKVAIGISSGDVLLFIPEKEKRSKVASDTDSLCLHLSGSSLALAFLQTNEEWNREKDVLQMPVNLSNMWEDIFASTSHGYYLNLKSAQGLYTASLENGSGTLKDRLVPMFGSRCSYNPSEISTSVDDVSLSVSETQKFLSAYDLLISVCNDLVESSFHISGALSSLNIRKLPVQLHVGTSSIWGIKNSSKAFDLFTSAQDGLINAISTSRSLLNQIKEKISSHDCKMKSKLLESEKEIDRLRQLVFLKEKDRLAALALIAPQATGWIRMGGTHQSGQRVASNTTTVWPYWAALRRSLLILFTSPGDDAVCFISLQGAQLYPLLCERSKRGVKRGFAIVESTGVTHYFVAGSGSEYDMWTRQLHRATKYYSSAASEPNAIGSAASSVVDRVSDSDNDSGGQASTQRKGSLTKDWEDDDQSSRYSEDIDSSVSPNKIVNIRQKLAAVKTGTSHRFGSAVQNAKQNVKAAKERRRRRAYSEDSLGSGGAADISTMSEVPGDFKETESKEDKHAIGEQPRTATNNAGVRNRFGLAMQKAKQNVKIVNEKRRQRTEDTNSTFSGDPAQVYDMALDSKNNSLHGAQIQPDRPIENIDFHSEVRGDTDDFLGGEGGTVEPSESQDFQHEYDYQQDDVANRRTKIGNKVSKIGAAVKSVRLQGNRSNRAPREDDGKGRFGLRRFNKGQSSSTFNAGATGAVKIRLATIGAETLDISDSAPVTLLEPLKSVHGQLLVHVETLQPDEKDYVTDASKLVPVPVRENDGNVHTQSNTDTVTSDDIQNYTQENTMEQSVLNNNDQNKGAESSHFVYQSELNGTRKFRIIFLDKKYKETDKEKVVDGVVRSLSDVLSLQTLVSESLNQIPLGLLETESSASRINGGELNSNLASQLGLTPLDSVLLAAKLLGCLFQYERMDEKISHYQCEILGDFLNIIINCPLPKSVHGAVENFLGLENLVGATPTLDTIENKIILPKKSFESLSPSDPTTSAVLSLTSACESEMSKAENLVLLAQKIASSGEHMQTDLSENQVVEVESAFVPPSNRALNAAIEEKMMKVMAERDEAQKKMYASRVLHIRELNDEKIKIDRLTKAIEKNGGESGDESKETNNSFNVVQSTDAELLFLCQQLASEISEKTSLALETIRLKELLETHQIKERSENEALHSEVKNYKELVANEKNCTEKARKEAENWKQMYENLLSKVEKTV